MRPLGEQEFVGIQLDPNQPLTDDLPDLPLNEIDGSNKDETQSDTNTGAKPMARSHVQNVTYSK